MAYHRSRGPSTVVAGNAFPVAFREGDVRRLCTVAAFRWGDKLQREGHVSNATVVAIVGAGSGSLHPANTGAPALSGHVYGIWRRMDSVMVKAVGGHMQTSCTCKLPFCRHAAALLLHWLRKPASFTFVVDRFVDDEEIGEYYDDDLYEDEDATGIPALTAGATWSEVEEAAQAELKQLLNSVNMNDLRAMARQRGVTAAARTKVELVQILSHELADPGRIDAALAGLTPDEQLTLLAVDLLTAIGGANIPEIRSAYAALGGKEQYQASAPPPALTTLRELGLVLPATRNRYEVISVVPHAVTARIPSRADLLRPADSGRVAGVTRAGAGLSLLEVFQVVLHELANGTIGKKWPTIAQEDLQNVPAGWRVDRSNPDQSSAGGTGPSPARVAGGGPQPTRLLPTPQPLATRDIARLVTLTGRPAEMVDFALSMMLATGLLEVAGTPDQPHLAGRVDHLDALLALPVEDRLAYFGGIWLGFDDSRDLRLVTGVTAAEGGGPLQLHREPFGYPARSQPPGTVLRDLIARLISRLQPSGEWSDFRSLFDLIRALKPGILQAPTTYSDKPVWWFSESRHSSRRLDPSRNEDWELVAGALVGAILSGPMSWLGFVEVLSDGNQVIGFRTRLEAETFAGRKPTLSAPDKPPQLIVQIDVDTGLPAVTVPAGTPNQSVHALLRFFAVPAGTSAAGLRYVLTVESVQRAFDDGFSGPEIAENLEDCAGRPLPKDVRAAIEQWWGAFGQVRLYDDVALIELGEDVLLEEILATAPLRRRIIHTFSPRLLAVDPAAVDEIVAALQAKGGHLPRLVEEP